MNRFNQWYIQHQDVVELSRAYLGVVLIFGSECFSKYSNGGWII